MKHNLKALTLFLLLAATSFASYQHGKYVGALAGKPNNQLASNQLIWPNIDEARMR